MKKELSKTLLTALALSSVPGCSQAPNDYSDTEGAVGTVTAAAQLQIKGRTYKLVGEANRQVVSETLKEDATAEVGPDHRKMSLDELARAITPVIFTSSGYQYRAVEPDYELARNVQRGFKAMEEAEKAEREGRVILGGDGNTDDRVADRNNTSFPNSTFMFSELGCTATMISPSVAITAAHCVYRSDTDQYYVVNGNQSGAWRSPRYTAGVDGLDADPFPFSHPYFQAYEVACTAGSIPNCTSISETHPNGPHLQCYSVAIPQSFINASTKSPALTDDYAAIDFSGNGCDGHPGNQTGWLSATNLLTQTQIQAAGTANLWGYPARATNPVTGGEPANSYYTKWWSSPAPSSSHQLPNSQEAVLFGMSGTASLPSSSSVEVRYSNIDTTGGQSGSSVWRVLNNTRQVFAIHKGSPASLAYNWGRRWDATVKNFVDTSTTWPN